MCCAKSHTLPRLHAQRHVAANAALEIKRLRDGLSLASLITKEGEDDMFHHILFPIDFSKRCNQATPFVKAFANRYRAKVTLMHVIHIPTGWYGGVVQRTLSCSTLTRWKRTHVGN
jgi:hypothetical protein